MKRRDFFQSTLIGATSVLIPVPQSLTNIRKEVQLGLMADVHQDIMPDGEERLEVFINNAIQNDYDGIIQLGDFCMKKEENKSFLNLWNQFKGPKLHVLGNHDMDIDSKEEIMDFWEMPSTFYTQKINGIKILVLDANFLYQEGKYIDYHKANFYVDNGFRTFISPEQIAWLKAELASSTMPVLVLSHQSLWHYQWGVKNRLSVQKVLEKYSDKIICCLNGHNHIDYHHFQNGIHYIEINSMSYQWLGEKYKAFRYSEQLHEKYKLLTHVAPYQDPLFAAISISEGVCKIKGIKSNWLEPSPDRLKVPEQVLGSVYSPAISDYHINF